MKGYYSSHSIHCPIPAHALPRMSNTKPRSRHERFTIHDLIAWMICLALAYIMVIEPIFIR